MVPKEFLPTGSVGMYIHYRLRTTTCLHTYLYTSQLLTSDVFTYVRAVVDHVNFARQVLVSERLRRNRCRAMRHHETNLIILRDNS